MQNLIHAIYTSAASKEFSKSDLAALLLTAREKNTRVGLTGMLLYTSGSFFQILEGEPETVATVLAVIAADQRHSKMVLIIQEPIGERSFGEWSMGCASMTRKELEQVDGFNDFFSTATCLDHLDEGRAKKLLAAFAKGRWRTTLTKDADSLPARS